MRTIQPIRDVMGAEHPSPCRLIAYQQGEMSPTEVAAITEHLSFCEECAAFVLDAAEFFGEGDVRVLADLAAFPDVEPAPGTPELSDDEIAALWTVFRERLPA